MATDNYYLRQGERAKARAKRAEIEEQRKSFRDALRRLFAAKTKVSQVIGFTDKEIWRTGTGQRLIDEAHKRGDIFVLELSSNEAVLAEKRSDFLQHTEAKVFQLSADTWNKALLVVALERNKAANDQ